MAVTIDTPNVATTSKGSGSSSDYFITGVTISAGVNMLVYCEQNAGSVGSAPIAVIFDGVAMTLISSIVSASGGQLESSIWALANPPVGAGKTLEVQTPASGFCGGTLVPLFGTSGVIGTPVTGTAANNTPACTATGGVTGDLYLGIAVDFTTTITGTGANQSAVGTTVNPGLAVTGLAGSVPGANAGVFSWTGGGTSGGAQSAACAVVFKAAGAVAPRRSLPLTGVGAIAPLAWIIRRRQIRAKERNAELRQWTRDDTSGLLLPSYKKAS